MLPFLVHCPPDIKCNTKPLIFGTSSGQLLEAGAVAIERIGGGNEETVSALIPLLENKSANIREKGIRAIGTCHQKQAKVGMAIPGKSL